MGQHHFGELRLERAQAKAERIIGQELVRLGWQAAVLASRRKQVSSPSSGGAGRPKQSGLPPQDHLRRDTTLDSPIRTPHWTGSYR